MENPFRIDGIVRPPHFTNRERELGTIRDALGSPGAKLLVYGPRRLGKTSAIIVAKEAFEAEADGSVVMADFSTASSVADLAHRLLSAAGTALGRRWRDFPTELARRLEVTLRLETDPATGIPVPVLGTQLRRESIDEQYGTLGRLLDALEEMASERGTHLAVILDEFQEIHRFGGEESEWRLRGVLQHHRHTSYVLAGSKTSLIRRMLGKDRALYKLVDLLAFGPIEPGHFARWIEERFEEANRPSPGVGRACLRAAGPRTRDVVQLARRSFDLTDGDGSGDPYALVRRAFLEVVEEEDDLARSYWQGLTANQQNVLRAVAAAEQGLTASDTRKRYGLPTSGAVSGFVSSLVEDGYLVKVDEAPGYDFDSPFLRGWVVHHALADIGVKADLLERPAGRAYLGETFR